jgi:hypothetical protein
MYRAVQREERVSERDGRQCNCFSRRGEGVARVGPPTRHKRKVGLFKYYIFHLHVLIS